jgi:hypothetical protein
MPRSQKIVKGERGGNRVVIKSVADRRSRRQERWEERRDGRVDVPEGYVNPCPVCGAKPVKGECDCPPQNDRKVDLVEAKTDLNNSKAAKRRWLAVLLGIVIGCYFGFRYLGWF